MTTQQVIETLKEAQRYVRSDPREFTRLIMQCTAGYGGFIEPRTTLVDRLFGNLLFAMDYVYVEPDVAKGYVDGAWFEFQIMQGKENGS